MSTFEETFPLGCKARREEYDLYEKKSCIGSRKSSRATTMDGLKGKVNSRVIDEV